MPPTAAVQADLASRADPPDPDARLESPADAAGRALSALGAAIADATDHAPAWSVAELLAAAAADLAQGAPLPALGRAEAEAQDWASWAAPREVKAYLSACWDRLTPGEQAAFLKKGGAVAALDSAGNLSDPSSEDDIAPPQPDPLRGAEPGRGPTVDRPLRRPRFLSAADFAGRPVPERSWIVHGWIPDRTVTLFSGDGGTGKSTLALQLAVAVVAGGGWLGRGTDRGSVLVLSAEDDQDELHRRLDAILRAGGLAWDAVADLTLCSLAGKEAQLVAPGPQLALLETALLHDLRSRVAADRPRLVVLDTSADLFGGNENDRAQVRWFIGRLRGIALQFGCAVVLLSHPSLSGLGSGTGTSGSTAWNNSVRSRLYLSRIVDEGAEPDPDKRVLQVMKANYGRTGEKIGMTWRAGAFQADADAGVLEALRTGARAERVFLDLLRLHAARGQHVSANPSSSYAPSRFASHPKADGVTKQAFARAMEGLLDRGAIVIATHGTGAKARRHLALAAGSGDEG